MKHARFRHGFTVIEAMTAVAILAAALVVAAQMIVAVRGQQRRAQQRYLATEEAANRMEQAFALPWSELTTAQLSASRLSPAVVQRLPGATLEATVEEGTEELRVKKIRLEVRWGEGADTPLRSVQLVAWRYGPREAQP
jgi:prepilin-type N-terminal cleavage/methylation domain-containing protein